MALYDYVCVNGHITEISKPMGQVVQVYCPACGERMRRVFSATQFFVHPSLSPAMRAHVERAPERRAELEGKK